MKHSTDIGIAEICNALSVDICSLSANCAMIRAILFYNKKSNYSFVLSEEEQE
ncbi:hypothetical protein [Segatella hominis]|uniref:hypothetical protein n=1 Tax=Segatella hominis TaxID=2518605 RepID=UPI003AB92056